MNTKNVIQLVLSLLFMSFISSAAQAESFNCKADASWFKTPKMPTEVAQSIKGTSSNFCDFYQFSWQALAYLMTPSLSDPKIRNFQSNLYNQLEINSDGKPANSCDDKHDSNTLFIRITKTDDAGAPFVIPEDIHQAGGGATIYDQNQNVVYYDVRFSKNMCNISAISSANNFPPGTLEMKTAWKVMGPKDDQTKYLTMSTKIGSSTTPTTLGMIGFHTALATKNHPEFVWATFEHKINAPDCVNPTTSPAWDFASQTCQKALVDKDIRGIINCKFNTAIKQKNPATTTSTPTQICREYAYGSAKGDLKYDENVGDITSLNNNVQPFLTGSYAILKNYFNVGAIWLSDTSKSSDIGNQRGSLRLANTVAETEHQNVDLTSPVFISNCFGCHNFSGTGNNTTSGALSHIFDDIIAGSVVCVDVQASSLINSQPQAEQQCPTTCSGNSIHPVWNGQWTNKGVPMTVCGCCSKK